MEPTPRAGISYLPLPKASPSTLNIYPQVDPPFSKEHLQSALKKEYDHYCKFRFPFEPVNPIIAINAIVARTFKAGAIELKGLQITVSTERRLIQFESSNCLKILKPLDPVLAYPVEALEYILNILKVPREEVEVTEVKDEHFISWITLKSPSIEEIWTVECYSLKFTQNKTKYHFTFDTKLRFFRDVINDKIFIKESLLKESEFAECLKTASLMLNLPLANIEITKVTRDYDEKGIGYLVEFNNGPLSLFLPA